MHTRPFSALFPATCCFPETTRSLSRAPQEENRFILILTKSTHAMHGAKIRSRQITQADIPVVVPFLAKGLSHPKEFFYLVFDRLTKHQTPVGYPKYGYVLESDNSIAGVIILIFSIIPSGDMSSIRCHVTSWYVEPAFRVYAAVFFTRVINFKEVTYINISALPNTVPIIDVQGFSRYANGQYLTVPLMHRFHRRTRTDSEVDLYPTETVPRSLLDAAERELLERHSEYGCLAVWCVASGRAHPFVFQPRLFKGLIPGTQLIYCHDIDDFVRFAQPLGKYLAAWGIFLVKVDANGRIPGLIGTYFAGREPRFYKGVKPRLGDLAYTQVAMCPPVRRGWLSTVTALRRILHG